MCHLSQNRHLPPRAVLDFGRLHGKLEAPVGPTKIGELARGGDVSNVWRQDGIKDAEGNLWGMAAVRMLWRVKEEAEGALVTWTEDTRVPSHSVLVIPEIVCEAVPTDAKGMPSVMAKRAYEARRVRAMPATRGARTVQSFTSESAEGSMGRGWLVPLVALRNAQKNGEERVTASEA